mmetsp:Transcript_64816/g.189644  ORF Transcript_64816/g.189644 Transcript_64816/m.189644 type:complete len:296 (+) Transcript_64816:2554-3441(+)
MERLDRTGRRQVGQVVEVAGVGATAVGGVRAVPQVADARAAEVVAVLPALAGHELVVLRLVLEPRRHLPGPLEDHGQQLQLPADASSGRFLAPACLQCLLQERHLPCLDLARLLPVSACEVLCHLSLQVCGMPDSEGHLHCRRLCPEVCTVARAPKLNLSGEVARSPVALARQHPLHSIELAPLLCIAWGGNLQVCKDHAQVVAVDVAQVQQPRSISTIPIPIFVVAAVDASHDCELPTPEVQRCLGSKYANQVMDRLRDKLGDVLRGAKKLVPSLARCRNATHQRLVEVGTDPE